MSSKKIKMNENIIMWVCVMKISSYVWGAGAVTRFKTKTRIFLFLLLFSNWKLFFTFSISMKTNNRTKRYWLNFVGRKSWKQNKNKKKTFRLTLKMNRNKSSNDDMQLDTRFSAIHYFAWWMKVKWNIASLV